VDKPSRAFANFAVIDWSGEAVAKPKGLAVAHAALGTRAPNLLSPEGGWSRQRLLEWLRRHAEAKTDILVGFDLSPALPFADTGAYFPDWPSSPPDAKALWALVDRISSADQHLAVSSFLRHPDMARHFRQQNETGDLFPQGRGRLRLCEVRQRVAGLSPSSCFNLIGAAQVGKSSLTGMRVLNQLRGAIPVWPFDPLPASGPVLIEIYTTIAARAAAIRKGLSKMRDADSLDIALEALGSERHAPLARYDDHATDAILTTAWLRIAAHDPTLWHPAALTPAIAATEGWTFGVA
jgi:hypothetical protein